MTQHKPLTFDFTGLPHDVISRAMDDFMAGANAHLWELEERHDLDILRPTGYTHKEMNDRARNQTDPKAGGSGNGSPTTPADVPSGLFNIHAFAQQEHHTSSSRKNETCAGPSSRAKGTKR